MPDLPGGTVTFLFTDIEGSTQIIQALGDERAAEVFAAHHRILRETSASRGGHLIESQGDGFLFAFQAAMDAVQAAAAAQMAVHAYGWPVDLAIRVRMGLHTGEPVQAASGYVGLDVHRASRICQAGWGGQILLSYTTYELVRRELPGEFGVRDLGEHRLKDLRRPERIYQLLHTGLPTDPRPVKSLDSLPNNLPRQLTSFIGRDREMTEVKRFLAWSYLLTLTGSGGCGKTRLALQVAADLIEMYRDGVWLVELAPLSDPARVPQAAASALHVREQPGRQIADTLIDHLKSKQLLLILDNCEHVIGACAHLAEALLRACPHLRILATSQQPLRIAGETSFRVPSLALPDLDRLPPLDNLTQTEAVQLFTDRARAAFPAFEATDRNAPFLAQICHRLDGIPLAIELAAARVRILPVEQIASRLDDRFRLLTGGSRTTLPRHQTLRSTMDWSYALLEDQEQLVLQRLSSFVGGWTLDAAEAVCAGAGVAPVEVLELLGQLVDKSLVVVDDDVEESRYRLLETVRQYAQEKLVESEQDNGIRQRHRDWFLTLAEQAEPHLRGPAQSEWVRRLEVEHDNLRAALEFCKAEGDLEAGLRLAGALGRFWWVRGHFSEGRDWLARFLSQTAAVSVARARALFAAGGLAWNQADYGAAEPLCTESLALFRVLGDQQGMLDATNLMGLIAIKRGEYRAARGLYEEAFSLVRATGDQGRISLLLSNAGHVAEAQGDYARARALHEQSLSLSRELGDSAGVARSLNNLGIVALAQGDTATAEPLFREALADFQRLEHELGISNVFENLGALALRLGDHGRAAEMSEASLSLARRLGDKECIAGALAILGRLARRRADYAGAASLYGESLSLRRETGDRREIAESLLDFAGIACDRGEAVRAAQLLGAAETLREAIGAPLPPADRPEYDSCAATALSALGGEAFSGAREEGRAVPLVRVIEDLLTAYA